MDFEWEDEALQACMEEFNKLAPEDRLFMSHYELAEESSISDTNIWKAFLSDLRVQDWVQKEVSIYVQAMQRKLIKGAGSTNSKSVGAAQMLTALAKTKENTDTKEGAVFIYNYVPLNPREQIAPNTVAEPHDIFFRE